MTGDQEPKARTSRTVVRAATIYNAGGLGVDLGDLRALVVAADRGGVADSASVQLEGITANLVFCDVRHAKRVTVRDEQTAAAS